MSNPSTSVELSGISGGKRRLQGKELIQGSQGKETMTTTKLESSRTGVYPVCVP